MDSLLLSGRGLDRPWGQAGPSPQAQVTGSQSNKVQATEAGTEYWMARWGGSPARHPSCCSHRSPVPLSWFSVRQA